MAAGRSPWLSARRRSSKKGPPTPSSRPPAQELVPLPPGTEVEVRIDDDGFFGSWYEATVVGFYPASGRRPAQYTVTYSHLVSEDGPETADASCVRPRPPPPPSSAPGSSSSAPPPAPRYLLHDIVEAFDGDGWWSGIVVAPVSNPGSPVTVAFPITCEIMSFPPHLVRHRRDYVGGEWVRSMAVFSVQPKRGVRVYKAGEKVEVLREREAYGDSWFPATVAKAIDRFSYIVQYEYLDEQEGGGKATDYRHLVYIRPAEYHRLRESKARLGPGTAVEVLCDGAWSQGVVRRVVGEGCEYEVSLNDEEMELLLTKAAEQLRPLCMWNGRHWRILTDKGQGTSRQQSSSRKHPISHVDAEYSYDDHGCDPASSTAKKSRREPQQQGLILEHASATETEASLSASCKPLASDHYLNSCSSLFEKDDLPELPHKVVSTCSVPKDGLLCASSGHSAPLEANNCSLNSCPPLSENNDVSIIRHKTLSTCSVSKNGLLCTSTGHTAPPLESNHSLTACLRSEKNGLSMLAHKIVSTCSMSKNWLLCTSSGHSAPPDESISNAIGEADCSQYILSEMVLSEPDGQLHTPVCGRNADEVCDMLSIPEEREPNIASSPRNQQTQERPFFVKALSVKKGISKSRSGETQPRAHQRKNDASDHVQIQLKENRNLSSIEMICPSSASPECQTTSAQTAQASGGTSSSSDTEGGNFKKLAREEDTALLDKELAATINRIFQVNRNADVPTDTAATQVTESNPLTDIPILSHDRIIPPEGNEVDEGSINLRNAESCSVFGSSMPSHMAFSQISDHQVPFVKSSPAWPLIYGMDVFKKVPQQPHFHPLRQFLPVMREGMALGLMVTFASLVEEIRKSSLADSIASFEEKICTLRHLEENGFSVQILKSGLIKLLQIKSDHTKYLAEKDQLKAQLVEKTTFLVQIDERLDKKEQAIAELEEVLGHARWEAQKIAGEKEHEDQELSRLKEAACSIEETCAGAEMQFQSVMAALRHKSLT